MMGWQGILNEQSDSFRCPSAANVTGETDVSSASPQ